MMMRHRWMLLRHWLERRLLKPVLWLVRLLRWLVLLISGLFSLFMLLLVLLVMWLLLSQPGGQWLLNQVPGLEVQGFRGQLLNRWQADHLRWQDDDHGLQVELEQLSLRWSLTCLLEQRLCLRRVQASQLHLVLPADQGEAVATPEPVTDWQGFRMPELQLPQVELPLALQVDALQLGAFKLNEQLLLQGINLQLKWQASQLTLQHLSLTSPLLPEGMDQQVQLAGQVDFQNDWPLQLLLQGGLGGYPLHLAMDGSLARLHLDLQLDDPEQARVLQLVGWINLLQAELPVDLLLDVPGFYPAADAHAWLDFWPEQLELDQTRLQLQGDLESGWQLLLESQVLWAHQPLLLDLSAGLDFEQLSIEHLQLYAGQHQQLQMAARLGQAQNKSWQLEFGAEGQWLLPELGLTDFILQLQGDWAPDQQTYQLSVEQLQLHAADQQLQLVAALNQHQWSAELQLDSQTLPQTVTATDASLPQGDVQLQLATRLPTLWSPLMESWPALNVLLQRIRQGELQLGVQSQAMKWQDFALQQADFAFRYQGDDALNPELELQFRAAGLQQDEQRLERLQLIMDGHLQQHQLQLALSHQGQPLQLELTGGIQEQEQQLLWMYQLAPFAVEQLAYFWPEDLRWQEQLTGYLQGQWRWTDQVVFLEAELLAEEGVLAVQVSDPLLETSEWVELAYHRLVLGFTLDEQRLAAGLTLDGDQLGYFDAEMALALHADAATGQRALQGQYLLRDLQLQLLIPFLDLDELSGQLQGQGEIKGHLLEPELWGSLQLQQVTASDQQWPLSLNHLEGELRLQGHRALLDGRFEAGRRGEGQIQGELVWRPELEAVLMLQAEQLEIRVEPWATLIIQPDLQLGYRQQRLHLSGRLAVPSGQIVIRQLPPQAVRVSDDARLIDQDERDAAPLDLDMDVEVLLGSQRLQLDAFGLLADLQGRLRIGNDMDTRGELLLVNGSYQSWGQDLRLRRARLVFAGPVELPFLDVEAVRTTSSGVVAGLRITGRADEPQTEIFSEPAMPSEQALAYLVLGRPLRGESDDNAMNTAAISLGLRGATGVTQRIGDTLGVRDLQLETEGEGEAASVMASGYLNERLSVRYGVGLYDEVTRFAVRYELTRQVYIEAASALASSLDIFWRVDY
ncbi:translocation/assembly module TamB domain-containing protein [Marinospirillum alkaliphilum]|uniref:Translocation and assembly module TamB C-terminal domain-containing protein n=1 Tax=Marinospirillum alkaliphilum DSM 21637 TaxID=1122209 RepID=A0A1K1VHV7_9GAMM|nr:translocation/assembly module TamB domain-containing protein [Marinospirillum alkaliphilum]SFX24339.1 Family of unknown function [Marinospirillum alkaliphilum DSM 21637]